MPRHGNGLTDKQTLFVEHYIQTWNATRSAEAAGYKGNDQTLRAVGYENLTKPHIRALIDARLEETRVTTDEITARLHAIATDEEEPTKNTLRALEILARHKMPTKTEIELPKGTIEVNLVPLEKDPKTGRLMLAENPGGG